MRIVPPPFVPALFVLTLMASCVAPPAPRPAPPAPRTPIGRAAPPPSPAALPADWRDWPLTPGTWSYRRSGQGSTAVFPLGVDVAATLSCDPARRTMELAVPAPATGPITIRTSTTRRTATAVLRPMAGDISPSRATTSFAASDPLLDAIAFSRGRWTIEAPGTPPLVLPAYAEVARVIEDCRG